MPTKGFWSNGVSTILFACATACIIPAIAHLLIGMGWVESLIKAVHSFLILSTMGVLYYSNKISSIPLVIFPLVSLETTINMEGVRIIPIDTWWDLTSGGLIGLTGRYVDEKIKRSKATKTT